jgi:hypothetical protein
LIRGHQWIEGFNPIQEESVKWERGGIWRQKYYRKLLEFLVIGFSTDVE